MTDLLDFYRRHGHAAPLARKIEATEDVDELRGLFRQARQDGRLTPELEAQCKARAEELKKSGCGLT